MKEEQLASKKSWLKAYPTGVRYDVRCLDGGCLGSVNYVGYGWQP